VYAYDWRDAVKQRIAMRLLADGIADQSLVLPHQSLLEFVAVVTRPRKELRGRPLLIPADALAEAESLLTSFPVVYPTREQFVTAIRGTAAYGLSWFDAQLWAAAEVNGLAELVSEDFQHGRHYGSVRAWDPFLAATGGVHELPALYGAG
jgi:predicted nucleic acid-binding protein